MKNNKRIGLLIDSLIGGGAERVVLNLAEGFCSDGHDVHIILIKNKIQHDISDSKFTIHALSKDGIIFKDITPLIKDPAALKLTVHQLIAPFLGSEVTVIAGMEARGFIFGSLVAWEMGLPFVPLRKPNKLPYDVESVSYDLEYGSATLEVHTDAFNQGDRVLLIDD